MRKSAAVLVLLSWLFLQPSFSHAQESGLKAKIRIVDKLIGCENEKLFCQRLAGEFSIKSLKKLETFRASSEGKMTAHEYYAYGYLAKIGMPVESMKIIDPYDLYPLVKGFKKKRWPAKFAKRFAEPSNFILYSTRAADSDPDFSKGLEWARNYLKRKLAEKEHAYRTSTDYEEDHRQLDGIENPHILFLLKKYLDYFESKAAKYQIPQLFRGEFGGPENGGLFFAKSGKLRFFPIPNDPEELRGQGESENFAYQNPRVQEYVPNIGLLHTHPIDSIDQGLSFSGPSGFAKYVEGIEAYMNDTGVLRKMNHGNPFFIDTVVTQMGNGRFNIDAYFRDVYAEDGLVKWKKDVTVIDPGMFSY